MQILQERSRSRIPKIFYSGRTLKMIGKGLKTNIGKKITRSKSFNEIEMILKDENISSDEQKINHKIITPLKRQHINNKNKNVNKRIKI